MHNATCIQNTKLQRLPKSRKKSQLAFMLQQCIPNAVHVEVVAFKDSCGRRELDLDDFTYSENWMQLTADESIDLEHQILQIIAKEYPEYE
jgi:hypothetical protein